MDQPYEEIKPEDRITAVHPIVKLTPEEFFGETGTEDQPPEYRWSGALILLTKNATFKKGVETKGLFSRFFYLLLPQKNLFLFFYNNCFTLLAEVRVLRCHVKSIEELFHRQASSIWLLIQRRADSLPPTSPGRQTSTSEQARHPFVNTGGGVTPARTSA